MLTFDDVLKEVGEFGKYQKWITLILSISGVTFSFLIVVVIFLGTPPKHRCKTPGSAELRERCGWSLEEEMNYTLPLDSSSSTSYSQCEKYNIDWNTTFVSCENPLLSIQNGTSDMPRTGCNDGWVFESSRSSIVIEYELVCKDAWMLDMSQASIETGFLVGAIITGYIADRFGRKVCLLISLFGVALTGIIVSFAPNYPLFLIFRILQGIFGRGISWLSVTTEIVGAKYRKVVAIITQSAFGVGIMLLPGIAYWIRSWKGLQIAASVPNFILLLYCCLIPESPRWLLSRKRNREAFKITQHMAEQNGKCLPANYNEMLLGENITGEISNPSILDLFRTPQMRKHTLILMYSWFTGAVVYLGLILRLGLQEDDVYFDVFIAGVVELPATFLSVIAVDRVGRRKPFILSNLMAGLFCVISIFISKEMYWLKSCLVTLGRFAITMSFSVLYLVNTELYPTSIRNLGVSVCSSLSDIGGIVTPFLLFRLGFIWSELPIIVFGVLALSCSGLLLLLPETRGMRLPETVEDVENISR
uniref:Solute carrier family 22 member 3 n=1 Tax=Callorhinchus milii TaxID=7868 RepID=A0A4W3KEI8_CALMI